jgi:hypothetical protein
MDVRDSSDLFRVLNKTFQNPTDKHQEQSRDLSYLHVLGVRKKVFLGARVLRYQVEWSYRWGSLGGVQQICVS